jgi:CheY-like chemotaxis protein
MKEDLREMMREAFEANGYTVVTAPEGQEALDRIAEIEGLCLVLLDLVMPA